MFGKKFYENCRVQWLKNPIVMITCPLAFLSAIVITGIYIKDRLEGSSALKYKSRYIVIRPDDPLVHKIKSEAGLDTYP